MGTFRGDATLATWLMHIVVNEALGRSRRNKRGAEVIAIDSGGEARAAEDTMNDNPANPPERLAASAQARPPIEANIDAPPGPFPALFLLRAVAEVTVAQCALDLALPAARVRAAG